MDAAEMAAMAQEHEYEEEQMLQGESMEDEEGEEMLDENGEYPQFSFPSFSPTSRKRVRLRKPNFSEQCLELLIQLVNEHRDLLYTKQAYTNEVHEKKIMVWTHITSQINAMSSIPRTMEEVRKKWNDYSYYVKKKRELAKRNLEKGLPVSNRQESARTRDREDRVLAIVENAQIEALVGNLGAANVEALNNSSHDNISSLLLDAAQRARKEANYQTEEIHASEDASQSSSPGVEQQPPKKIKYKGVGSGNYPRTPRLPPPMTTLSNGPAGYHKPIQSPADVRRSNRIRTPVKNVYPMPQVSVDEISPGPGRGRGRGRGRGAGIHYVHSRADEDLVLVNRQRLAIERRRLNVEKARLRVERRRLEIEEERFKWQKQERAKLYPPSPIVIGSNYEDANENMEESQHQPEDPNTSIPQLQTVDNLKGEVIDEDEDQTGQQNSGLQPVHIPSSPMAQQAPSLTPVAETF